MAPIDSCFIIFAPLEHPHIHYYGQFTAVKTECPVLQDYIIVGSVVYSVEITS